MTLTKEEKIILNKGVKFLKEFIEVSNKKNRDTERLFEATDKTEEFIKKYTPIELSTPLFKERDELMKKFVEIKEIIAELTEFVGVIEILTKGKRL